jgi:hypothetical protein
MKNKRRVGTCCSTLALLSFLLAASASAAPGSVDWTTSSWASPREGESTEDWSLRTDIVRQISGEQYLLQVSDAALYNAYFQITDVAPTPTPDGHGAYSFYRGQTGRGAIYYDRYSRAQRAVRLYGDILTYFEAHGWKNWDGGYPVSAEEEAWGNCREQGGVRQQWFAASRVAPEADPFAGWYQNLTLCWSPSRGTWPVWTVLGKRIAPE